MGSLQWALAVPQLLCTSPSCTQSHPWPPLWRQRWARTRVLVLVQAVPMCHPLYLACQACLCRGLASSLAPPLPSCYPCDHLRCQALALGMLRALHQALFK